MNILAVDPSLTGTGWAWRDEHMVLHVGSIVQKEGRGMKRLDLIMDILTKQAKLAEITMLVIEGYAMGIPSKGGRVFDLGELGGIIKYLMWRAGMDILVVPPNNLKLFMLGRYKTIRTDAAGKKRKIRVKDLVKQAAEKHAGRAFASTDQSDAYSLLLMAEGYCDNRLLPRLKTHPQRKAMEGCDFLNGRINKL
jgi:Holliday junction resolvasome RuvABC endonuclease subunit